MMNRRTLPLVVVLGVLAIVLAGCGNFSAGLGNYNFRGLHCADFSGKVRDFTVVKWYSGDNGVKVETKEAGSVFFSEGTYVLFEEEKCPLCKAGG